MGPKHVGESQSVLMMINPIILLPYPYGSINWRRPPRLRPLRSRPGSWRWSCADSWRCRCSGSAAPRCRGERGGSSFTRPIRTETPTLRALFV
jgi:hypothetical protein